MRKLLFFGLIIMIASCKSKKITADSPNRFLIGNLAEVASEGNLANIYNGPEIEEGTGMFEEATVERDFTMIYPDSPNEALITWKDKENRDLHHIYIKKPGRWKSKTGIAIGTSYSELEEINEAPIKFYGFGWDYGGAVDWNGGKLEDSKIRVFIAPKETPDEKYYGDHIIEASKEEIEDLQLSVKTILYQD